MSNFHLTFPADFSDHEWEVTAKGWYSEARLIVSGTSYQLTVYDPARLAQDIVGELESAGFFFEPNLVMVISVTKANMQRAAENLVKFGLTAKLISE